MSAIVSGLYTNTEAQVGEETSLRFCQNCLANTTIFYIMILGSRLFRSSFPEVFCKKGVLKSFANFTGKHLCQSLFLNKVAGLRPTTLLTKRLWHRCFPVNFSKFLRIPFLQNTSGRLLLYL